MSRNENSKSKDKRLEETKKLEAELERSLAVAKVKAAHKEIEDTEKLRKRSVALSICKRLQFLFDNTTALVDVIKPEYYQLPVDGPVAATAKGFEQTYSSIRYDFQKNLDLGEDAMARMFPLMEIRKDIVLNLYGDLIVICNQLQQMRAYCERLLV